MAPANYKNLYIDNTVEVIPFPDPFTHADDIPYFCHSPRFDSCNEDDELVGLNGIDDTMLHDRLSPLCPDEREFLGFVEIYADQCNTNVVDLLLWIATVYDFVNTRTKFLVVDKLDAYHPITRQLVRKPRLQLLTKACDTTETGPCKKLLVVFADTYTGMSITIGTIPRILYYLCVHCADKYPLKIIEARQRVVEENLDKSFSSRNIPNPRIGM